MTRLKYALLVAAILGAAPFARAADDPPKQVRMADAAPTSPTPTKVTSIEGITEYRLPNGFRALLMPDGSKPQVHVHCTVLVGTRHEGYGEAGMAHLLEHMNCKGTATHPDIMKALRDRGARFNATTSSDRTNYYETLPASDDNLEFAIRLEADRLVNTVVKRDQLVTEMTVVRNEFEIKENNPDQVLAERITHAAYRWHNYAKTVYGNRADIERVPVESLQAFYKKHYRVDNAVLVVTGKFDEARAAALIGKYFGPLRAPAEKLTPTYTIEPPQDGERQVVMRRAGTVGAIGAAYHIPANAHPDYPALQVLAQCLSSESPGRLYKTLVETKKATDVGGLAIGRHDPGLLIILGKVTDPAQTESARDALVRTLEAVADQPITEEEVARVRKQFALSFEQSLANAGQMAHTLDENLALGDWRLFFWERDQTEKVTAADVNRVAAKYLTRNNRTVGIYFATQKPERVEIPETTDVAKRLDGYAGKAATTAATAFDPTPENLEKRTTRGTLGPIRTAFLPKPTPGNLARINLTLRYGNEQALAGRTLAAELVPAMLEAGTKTRTRQQLGDELTRLGAGMSVSGGRGVLQVTVTAKRADLPAVLAIVREVLREPAFPAAEFDLVKQEVLTNLAARKAEPEALAAEAIQRKFMTFPKTDVRYKPTTDETIDRVKALTLDDVKAVYSELIGAQAGELAAVGDFDPSVVTAGLEPTLKGWTSSVPYRRIAMQSQPIGRGRRSGSRPDRGTRPRAALTFLMTDTDPDYPAFVVGTYLLGGDSVTSRLGTGCGKRGARHQRRGRLRRGFGRPGGDVRAGGDHQPGQHGEGDRRRSPPS